jgi:2-polyprenyl-3-methyl-5-hydroxy-6-metoxy-1,4-benzoquinol methylase
LAGVLSRRSAPSTTLRTVSLAYVIDIDTSHAREFPLPEKRPCPVCGTSWRDATVFLEGNLDTAKLNEFSYASRKTPEYMNLALVSCPTCDLVYANDPPTRDELANAYHVADYDSSEEATDAAMAYLRAMAPTIAGLRRKESALEIGAGTGVLLDLLASRGFNELVGIEPSTAAIQAAPPHRREWIRQGVFEEQDFAPESFDLICCFMTMEHVLDPKVVANSAFKLLRPGGAFVTVTHDYRSRVNRAMGRRSPIIDIEHMQLFSERSIGYLLEGTGFERVSAAGFKNKYAFRYWWRLAPVPKFAKNGIARAAAAVHADGIKIALNVGNTMASGFKPS